MIIKSTKELHMGHPKMLVYGPAGSGKTSLIATAPNPIVLDSEDGLLSLKDHNIPYVSAHSIKDVEDFYKWLLSSKELNKYDTICIDSLSDIAEIMLADLKSKTKDPRQAFYQIQETVLGFLRFFRHVDKNVYITCKQDRLKDETTGGLFFGPSMPGQKVGISIGHYFDLYMALQVFQDPVTKVTHRALRTVRDAQYDAKVRTNKLDYWEAADLSALITKLKG